MDACLKTVLETICELFPLKSFWKHVIIIWTYYFFISETQEEDLKERIEDFEYHIKEFSQSISDKYKIDPIEKLNMIKNEFNERERDEKIKAKNEKEYKSNIDKIISLMKKMNPIYENILPPKKQTKIEEISKQEKFTIYNIKDITLRTYIDFQNIKDPNNSYPGDIKKREVTVVDVNSEYKIKRENSETDYILDESKSKGNIKFYNKFRKYIYYDSNEKVIPTPKLEGMIDVTNEIIDTKKVVEKTDIKIKEGTNRHIKYSFSEVTYKGKNPIKENEKKNSRMGRNRNWISIE